MRRLGILAGYKVHRSGMLVLFPNTSEIRPGHDHPAGAPGLGPMSVRREIVVFKEGFRSRKYCLSECTQVCALEANAAQPRERQ